jgi:hypothetical protein
MTQFPTVFVLLTALVSAHARDTAGNCITVDHENSPTVTLSGRITKHHKPLQKRGDLRAAEGFYLKLDTPLRANIEQVVRIGRKSPLWNLTVNKKSGLRDGTNDT